ncbi:MAG: helix-turn-helix transcriptional regulator [Inquilinus sp.]|uniref:helix-turn-helix transcriptional regulator n=1 Tax=Inquilinus sp. TaxID=1932117 RepID=UPI003F3111D1
MLSHDDIALTPEEAGRIVGRSPMALAILRTRGGGPVYAKRGRTVRYLRSDLLRWLEEGRRSSTAGEAA